MIDKLQQIQLKKLLSEAILLLCRNGLPIDSQFSIEAMIGITLGEDEVFLMSFHETVESSSTEKSYESPDKIVKYSDTDHNSRKTMSGVWKSTSVDNRKLVRQLKDIDNSDRDMSGAVVKDFSYDPGFNKFRYGVAVKNETDEYATDYSADFHTQKEDMSNADEDAISQNGDFESKVKLESVGYEGDGFERSACDSNSSQPLTDTRREISTCMKPVSSTPSSFWPPVNLKGRTRSQTMQRSTGSRYSSSSEQRQRGPVHLESSESLASVERLLGAIYPPTDNQSLRCHVCGAELKCRRTLMEHIRGTHLSIHSYHCPDCGLGFKWRSSLKHHRARNCTLPSVLAAAYDFGPLGR